MYYLFITLLLIFSAFAHAAPEPAPAQQKYVFQNPEQEKLFNSLLPNLRCLVCQNESLADSNAPLAEDLRQEIYQQVLAGKNQQEIITYLTDRYGDFILFKPPVQKKTYVLWGLPLVLLVLGGIIVFLVVRRHKSVQEEENL